MSIKLFILGRPGSGKSTAYRSVEKFLRQQEQYKGWSIVYYNDYRILYEMFWYENLFPNPKKPKQFAATKEHDGFDVKDFSVLDKALVKLEKKARERSSDKKEEIIIIEFARRDYYQAFKQFSSSFLKNSYFLFIEADVTTCLERIKERIIDPATEDDHFVSDFIILEYYGEQFIPSVIKTKKGESTEKNRAKTINSRGSLLAFNKKVEDFVQGIIDQEIEMSQSQVARKVPDPKVVTPLLEPLHH